MRKHKTRILHRRKKSPVSLKQKGLIILCIVVCSYLTGFISVLPQTQAAPLSQNTENGQELLVKPVLSSASKLPAAGQTGIDKSQIQEVSIGQSVEAPTAAPTPAVSTYGNAHQIDAHTWTVYVGHDPIEATAGQIYQALNVYRAAHGVNTLVWDNGLAGFANERAALYVQLGKLDDHTGFMNFLYNQQGFQKLGYSSLGENASFGFTLTGMHLIDEVYAADSEHNDNQLNTKWTAVGIGVSKTATDLVFGGQPL